MKNSHQSPSVDMGKNGREALLAACAPFLEAMQHETASTAVERMLNEVHGPGSALYERLAALVRQGVDDGWAANVEIDGPHYRRSRIAEPSAHTMYFSITTVYMDSAANGSAPAGDSLRGQYHSHPYGEFNMVVPLDEGAAMAGPNGWCHGGWTAPPPGSHHYPEAKGGRVIALFFLPAGRIFYEIKPPG